VRSQVERELSKNEMASQIGLGDRKRRHGYGIQFELMPHLPGDYTQLWPAMRRGRALLWRDQIVEYLTQRSTLTLGSRLQLVFLWIGTALFAAVSLFPPMLLTITTENGNRAVFVGYSFIGSRLSTGAVQVQVDLTRLFIHWIVIAVCTAVLLCTCSIYRSTLTISARVGR